MSRFLFAVFLFLCVQDITCDRCSDILGQIQLYNRNISDSDRQNKFSQMASSLGNFFRGTDHLWLRDVLAPVDSQVPVNWQFSSNQTRTFLSGDQHLLNYGSYANSDGTVVYFVNDWDQALIHDYNIDFLRSAVSLVIHLHVTNQSSSTTVSVLQAYAKSYASTLQEYSQQHDDAKRIFTKDNTYGRLNDWLASVESKDSRSKLLNKYTTGSPRRFDFSNKKLAPVSSSRIDEITHLFPNYGATLSGNVPYSASWFAIKDIATRVGVGLGSLGVARYFVLIEGPSSSDKDDILLDVKYQPEPLWSAFVSDADRASIMSKFEYNQARRCIKSEKAMDYRVDDYVGWLTLSDGEYSIRETSPWKETFDVDSLNSLNSFSHMAEQWAAIMATGHARSDNEYNPNWIPYSYEDSFTQLVGPRVDDFIANTVQFAQAYYQQLNSDWQCFVNSQPSL
eukprot:TRINITY_DN1118_c0_g1_i2.p1 TRINITY_DN1118_c0_g1~~TRINITY_DN1118_c0_g1_i2.p1  ORF type:complete len:451 (+),score=139.94 TRINITY_DN1118_c0_g1_i2:73-1425(+)